MLKRVLVKSGESAEGVAAEGGGEGGGSGGEEDKQVHHSERVMEHRRTSQSHTGTNTWVSISI